MVNFNLSEEEKNRIRNLHESHKKLHGTMVAEQTATTPPAGAKPTTTPPANTQSKYKLPEITDDAKYKVFIDVNGSPDMDPTGLYNMAKAWFKKNISEPRRAGTLNQNQYVEGVSAFNKWAGEIDNIAKYLLNLAAIQGINAQAFKTLGDDVITGHLNLNKVPKPNPNVDWSENMATGVGGMQALKNGMSILITNQLNKIK